MVYKKNKELKFLKIFTIKNKGFTLVEILVAMGIIALLAGIGVAGITQANRQARDADRVQSLEPIRAAMKDLNIKFPGNKNLICVQENNGSSVKVFIRSRTATTCGETAGRRAERTITLPNGKNPDPTTVCEPSTDAGIKFLNNMADSKLVYCGENGGRVDLPY